MGIVYQARDVRLERFLALKFLKPELVTEDFRRRFLQEARASSALHHPNIVHVYDIGVFEGQDYIAMEFVDGQSLRQILRERRLSVAEAVGSNWFFAWDGRHRMVAAGIVARHRRNAVSHCGDGSLPFRAQLLRCATLQLARFPRRRGRFPVGVVPRLGRNRPVASARVADSARCRVARRIPRGSRRREARDLQPGELFALPRCRRLCRSFHRSVEYFARSRFAGGRAGASNATNARAACGRAECIA